MFNSCNRNDLLGFAQEKAGIQRGGVILWIHTAGSQWAQGSNPNDLGHSRVHSSMAGPSISPSA